MSKSKKESTVQEVPNRETVVEKLAENQTQPEYVLGELRKKIDGIGSGTSVKEVLREIVTEVENLILKGK